MPISVERAKKFLAGHQSRQANLGISKSGGGNYYYIKSDGKYKIRILDIDELMIGEHWGVLSGKNGKRGAPLYCPKAFNNSPCPICEYSDHLRESDSDEEVEQGESIRARTSYPMLILDMDSEDNKRPLLYKAPYTVYKSVVEWLDTDDAKDMMDLENGRNIVITRGPDPKNQMTGYSVKPEFKVTPIKLDPKNLVNMRDLVTPLSYEDLEYALEHGELPENKEEKKSRSLQYKKPESSGEKPPTTYAKGRPSVKDQGDVGEITENVTDDEPLAHESAHSSESAPADEDDVQDPPLPSTQAARVLPGKPGPSSHVREKLEQLKARKAGAAAKAR